MRSAEERPGGRRKKNLINDIDMNSFGVENRTRVLPCTFVFFPLQLFESLALTHNFYTDYRKATLTPHKHA